MTEEETVQQDAPEQGTQERETPQQQAEREESEGKLEEQGASEGGGEEKESGEDDAAAKRHARVQKRIDQLTKQRGEAERRAREAEQELAKYKKRAATQPPADDPRPDFDAYDSVEKFQADYDQWARRQAKRESEATPAEESASPEYAEAVDRVENAAIDASERYPDFDQVVRRPDLPLTQEMVQAAADTQSPADVLYHLGKNQGEAERISKLSGPSLFREMGRIEARLEKGSNAAEEDPGTKAPDPIRTVGGSKARRDPKPDEMDIDQWMKWRTKQLQAK